MKAWTEKDKKYLKTHWGKTHPSEIALNLHKTVKSVKVAVQYYGIGKKISSICWDCENAVNGNNCSWVKDFTPVPGWKALETKNADKRETESLLNKPDYLVIECPNFKWG